MVASGPGADLMGQKSLKIEGFKRILDERTNSQDLAADEAKAEMDALPDFEPNMWRRMSMAPLMSGPEDTLEFRIQQVGREQ